MPKLVDHEERRRLIAVALLRVAADRGLEAVSLRHVAAEAGVSSGMVQHYFSTKDEMMTFALEVVSENVTARLAASAAPDEPSAPGAMLRALLVQLLPFDEQRRLEGRVALAFQAYAATNPTAAEALRSNTTLLRTHLAELIRTAQADGGVPSELDHLRTATALLAVVEGLGVHVLGEHYTADEALAVFDDHLATVFGSPGEVSADRRRRS